MSKEVSLPIRWSNSIVMPKSLLFFKVNYFLNWAYLDFYKIKLLLGRGIRMFIGSFGMLRVFCLCQPT